jgi:imidazolonepropionase-like amidohydrolase
MILCKRRSGAGFAIAVAIAIACMSGQSRATDNDPANDVLIRDVRVFDGIRVRQNQQVLVRDGRIVAIGTRVKAPAGIVTVDGRGKTLLPGLIDSHTHTWGEAPRDALRFGVTSELDMLGDWNRLPALKKKRESLARTEEADLWSAGAAVTAPGGHGTQYGMKVPALEPGADADAFVAARLAEGSDYIKIILEDFSAHSETRRIPTITPEQARGAIAAAHQRKALALVHVSRLRDGQLAFDGGADGLVHIFGEPGDAAFVAAAKKRKAFVIPTLSVLATMAQAGEGAKLAEDASLRPWLTAAQRDALKASFGAAEPKPAILGAAMRNVRDLHAAGVDILAGTDAGNPGTAHGVSMHGELDLLVRAGLSPVQALAAATSVPARRFGLDDRGRIAPGLRADLLLVNGDPTTDMSATRSIAGVWKNGYAIDRPQPQTTAAPLGEAIAAASLVDDFSGDAAIGANGLMPAKLGAGWMQTTDQMAGGASVASLKREGGALVVSGEIKAGFAFPWSGAMFFPASVPMQPADLSARKELVFRVRGDGRNYSAMLFSGAQMQSLPSMKPFVAGPEWKEVRIPLDGFSGADLARVRGFAFTAGQPAGAFRFEIDDVEVK